MPQFKIWRSQRDANFIIGVFSAVLLVAVCASPALAKSVQEYVGSAQDYVSKGNLSAAEIELRNAERQAPQDPTVHLRLAEVYLAMAKGADAEREAKAAATSGAKEDDYLPLQIEALLIQQKFDKLLASFPAGNRAPTLESKVRQGRASAYLGLHDYDHALASLREAVELDPASVPAKLALARALVSKKMVDEANTIVDQILTANSKVASALTIKAQILAQQGDEGGALKKINEALEIAPKDVFAHLFRANLYLIRQDEVDADNDLNPIIADNANNILANYLRALELASKKKFGDANDILTKISSAFPNLAEGFYLQGVVQFNLGQMGTAEDSLAKYVARVPDSLKASRLLAVIAMRSGSAPRAIGYLKSVLEKTQPDVATLSLLGQAYLKDGKLELAQAQFDAAAKLPAESPQTETRLALSRIDVGEGTQGLAQLEGVYNSETGATVAGPALVLVELRVGNVDKAAEVAQALVAKDSTNLLYQNLLGLVRVGQRDYQGAEAIFSAVVAHDPGFAPATHNLAEVYIATGRRDEAKKAYEALLAHKPGDVDTLLILADFAIAEGNWDSATDYIKQAQSDKPVDPRPSIKLVDVYLLQQNYSAAQSTVSQLLIQFPKSPDVLDAEARTQFATGDKVGAATTYQSAFELAPNSAVLRGRYVGVLVANKDFKTARDVLTKALAGNPRQKVAGRADLIRIEAEIGGLDAGLAKAREFATQDPNNPSYDIVASELYEKAGRVPDAIAVLEKWAGEQPSEPVLLALARLYLHAGNLDKGLALLQKRLQVEPRDIEARLVLAAYYLQGRQLDKAREEYERIIMDAPRSIMALNNLAWIDQQQGDIAKARELAERAVALEPQNPHSADTLGWIMVAQGDDAGALKYLKTASASSGDPNIRYHLAVALKGTGQVGDAKSLLEGILASKADFQSKADAQKLLQELTKG